MKRQIFIFFGPPGSGKGTQSDLLAAHLRLPVISAGELLRLEQNSGSALGKKISPILNSGKLAPNKLVFQLVRKRSLKADAKNGFMLDGFPRSAKQLPDLKKLIKRNDQLIIVVIEIRDDKIRSRLSGRRVCDCGATYHLKHNPPRKNNRCDLCGAKLYQRGDDRPAVINRRLKDYHQLTKQLLDYFSAHGRLIKVDGEKSIKQIQAAIKRELK